MSRQRGIFRTSAARDAIRGARVPGNLPDAYLAKPEQLSSGAVSPSDLPVQVTNFIGRKQELVELSDLLKLGRLVTLTGAGGSGKTRLALQLASEQAGSWPNGVYFVDFAPLGDPNLVAQLVAKTIGLRERPGRPVIDTLVAALRRRESLLLLDNCEHLVDSCAKLVDAVLRVCARVRVLATSREALGLAGERVYRVPSLSIPPPSSNLPDRTAALMFEAIQLFVDRALVHNPGFVFDDDSAAIVASVCEQLDGIPLAIELAAARLRSLSIKDIERRLGARFRLLTSGSRTALPRHQTLRALIDWSYKLLNYRDRCVLDRLSVFAVGFDLPSAEAVCASTGLEPFEVLEAVSSLVDKSLVLADSSGRSVRYRLLETVRQYRRRNSAAILKHSSLHATRMRKRSSNSPKPQPLARLAAKRSGWSASTPSTIICVAPQHTSSPLPTEPTMPFA